MSDSPPVLVPHLMTRQKSAGRAAAVGNALSDRLPDMHLRVAESHEESLELARTAEIVVCKGVTPELLDAAEKLRWIQALSSGLDRFTTDKYGYEPPGVDRLQEEGIVLTNLAGVSAEPMAEQAFGFMLAFARNLHVAARQQFDRKWGGYGVHGELEGSTLGIVGVGSVGTRAAELGSAFDMTVLGIKRDLEDVPDAVEEIYPPDELASVLERADYLLLSCPLTDETSGMIGAEEFEIMREDAVLVNVARGGILVEADLVAALETGEIRGAGLDVFAEEPLPEDSPLWDLPNVVLTPHNSGGSPRGDERMADLFAANYERYLEGDVDSFENRIV